MIEGLTEGRIVHYVFAGHDALAQPGEHRPSIVVRDWKQDLGTVNLQVFLDGANDNAGAGGSGTYWKTSVLYDPDGKPGTWHFPERA